jgi:hypothetical protein
VAMIYPEQPGRGKKDDCNLQSFQDKPRLSQARTILKASTDLAARVLNGTKPFAGALRAWGLRYVAGCDITIWRSARARVGG